MATNFEPHECVIFLQAMKIGTHENKAIHSITLYCKNIYKEHYTDISLLWGKYTRMFVPRFPGIPEMLYFLTPKAEGNITSRGFPGIEGQTFWYISREAMK